MDKIMGAFTQMCLKGFTAWAYKCNYSRLFHLKVSTIKGYLRDINRYYRDTLNATRLPYDWTDKTAEVNTLLDKQDAFDKDPERRARLPDKVLNKSLSSPKTVLVTVQRT